MGHYSASGIKVLDRAVAIMFAVADEPRTLAELSDATDLPRATAHRLATALESHRLLTRNSSGKWSTGPTMGRLAQASSGKDQLIDVAAPIMSELVHTTGESVQLYQLAGNSRICIAAQEPPSGLQNTVPVGTRMPLTAGSAAHVFLSHASDDLREALLPQAKFTPEELQRVRTLGWAESTSEREPGLASLSAPVFDATGQFIAALSISGAVQRLTPSPGQRWGEALNSAAEKLSTAL